MDFISVEIAEKAISENLQDFGTEIIPFEQSVSRILSSPILADRDFPPFNRVSMDGIAILGEYYKSGQRTFPIEAIQFAGQPQKTLGNPNSCIEVMTGSVLPKNTDSVIRYEDLKIENGIATLVENLVVSKNIHAKSQDRKAKDILLPFGHLVKSADLAVMASVGKNNISVKVLPKLAIVTSGDELVEVSSIPLPHQIRKSNIYALSGLLKTYSSEIKHIHLKDDLQQSIEVLKDLFQSFDVVVLSGGVSAGKKDYLPEALQTIGVKKIFHKIQQRPGKPMWFGKKNKTVAFALPGNPVSSFLCCIRYVIPWLKSSIGFPSKPKTNAILEKGVNFKPALSCFMQVQLQHKNGLLTAIPIEGGGSGDFANLSSADGFLELPSKEEAVFSKGEAYTVWRF